MSRRNGTLKHATAALMACIAISAVALAFPARADRFPLVAQTKVRVTVVQWIPSKGEYQKWEAVSGDFTISPEGTISLPLVGSMSVKDLDGPELAAKLAEEIKSKAGLIALPATAVEIIEYPPVYVVGSVTSPGEYKFRPGLTVLQALALSGGQYRPSLERGSKGQIGMLGDLQAVREEIMRTLGRIARLQAEAADRKTIEFPRELTEANRAGATEVMMQEQIIFEARRSGLQRQLQNLEELSKLFTAEIGVLENKTEALENRIKVVGEELAGVKSLVERGIATVSRRSDLEFAVANLQSSRLDEVTAIMRARQNLSETTRNTLSLRDKHQTDVVTELQRAQADLERLTINEDVLKKTLILSDASPSVKPPNEDATAPTLAYAIIRRASDAAEEIAASEATLLLPGDVVKVSIVEPVRGQAAGSAGVVQ